MYIITWTLVINILDKFWASDAKNSFVFSKIIREFAFKSFIEQTKFENRKINCVTEKSQVEINVVYLGSDWWNLTLISWYKKFKKIKKS